MKKAWLATLALAAAVPLLPAQQVNTDFDHRAPFSDYRTFSFRKVQTVNPLDASVLREGVRNDLQYHGWHQVPSRGDVAITVIGAQRESKQYQTFYDGLGPGYGWGGWGGWYGSGWGYGGGTSTTRVRSIPVGTLVVDLYDTHTHNLVWRGTSRQMDSDNMNKNTGKLQKAVDKMFYKFPPKQQR